MCPLFSLLQINMEISWANLKKKKEENRERGDRERVLVLANSLLSTDFLLSTLFTKLSQIASLYYLLLWNSILDASYYTWSCGHLQWCYFSNKWNPLKSDTGLRLNSVSNWLGARFWEIWEEFSSPYIHHIFIRRYQGKIPLPSVSFLILSILE